MFWVFIVGLSVFAVWLYSNHVTGDPMSNKVYISIPSGGDNPFIEQIEERMKLAGWISRHVNWDYRTIIQLRGKVQVVHIHWPEALWRSSSLLISLVRCFHFVSKALLSKSLGYRLVWSAHNVWPHVYRSMRLEGFMRKWILRTFDLVVGHAYNCKADLQAAFGSCGRKYVMAVHGHYEHIYDSSRRPAEMRQILGISTDDKVILMLTNWQYYKGHDRFLRIFTERNWPNLRLVVVGPSNPEVAERLRHPAVVHIGRYLSTSELADHLTVAGFMVLPYRQLTTSGAFFLAITLGKGVVAPDLPFFRLHAERESALIYSEADAESGLRLALTRIADGWIPNQAVIGNMREKYSWDKSCEVMSYAFEQVALTPPIRQSV